ncbi:MAG: hypothetical protein JSV56_08445 [Methanomassiliicoccales archaeon]|nr:MAG: hypothetical protein JSV56_08445 [Methanomassiliicoccales archaeon]
MTEKKDVMNESIEEENVKLYEMLNLHGGTSINPVEVDAMFSEVEDMFRTERYTEVLSQLSYAMSSCETAQKRIQGIGLSYALLSSQKLLDSIQFADMKDMELGVNRAKTLLSQAKRDYFFQVYDEAHSSIKEIKALNHGIREKHRMKLSGIIKTIESDIESSKGFGANVRKAERKIKEARHLFQNDLLVPSSEAARSAKELVEAAKEERTAIIKEAVAFVEKIIVEAKEIGIDVSVPMGELERAKALYLGKKYQMCMYATISAEEEATKLILQQVQKTMELKRSLEARFMEVARSDPSQMTKTQGLLKNDLDIKPNEPKAKITKPKNLCPACNNPVEYYHRYRRWYCSFCMKYL